MSAANVQRNHPGGQRLWRRGPAHLSRTHRSAAADMGEKTFSDKTALVTGASRGMGRAVALGLASAGADLALLARSQPDLDEVAEQAEH